MPGLLERPVPYDHHPRTLRQDARQVHHEVAHHLVTEETPEMPNEGRNRNRVPPQIAQTVSLPVDALHLRNGHLRDETILLVGFGWGKHG
jgi:hypothetical protein